MAENKDASLALKKPTVPQGVQTWIDGNTEDGERWILWVLSQIPRSVYHGGGDLAPREPRLAAEGTRDEENDVSGKKSKNRKQNIKRPSGSNKTEKNSAGNISDGGDDKNGDLSSPGKTKREELQERLRQKLVQHQRERKADSKKDSGKKKTRESKQSRDQRRNKGKKDGKKGRETIVEVDGSTEVDRKANADSSDAKEKSKAKVKQIKTGKSRKRTLPSDASNERDEENVRSVADTVEVNRVAGLRESEESGAKLGRPKKRRKLSESRLKELQRQLAAASKEREMKDKAGDMLKDDATGDLGSLKDTVQKREMEKALQRAKGERPKDNVAKIRKSIRKEKRKKEKSKEEWAKRVDALEKEKEARQERRETNIKERKEASKSQGKRPKKGGDKSRGKGKAHKGVRHGK